jgi:hypothetical protein
MDVRTFAPKTAAASAGWWVVPGKTCVAAYQPKGAADLATSYVNLANPGTNNAAPGVAPTFNAATGWEFNMVLSQYLTSGIVGGNSFSTFVRFSDGTTGALFGEYNPGKTNLNIYHNFGGRSYFRDGGSFDQAVTYANGVLGVTPVSAYANGAWVGNLVGSLAGVTAGVISIGCLNNNGTQQNFLAGKIQAFAIYSATLTNGEVVTLSAAMAAL